MPSEKTSLRPLQCGEFAFCVEAPVFELNVATEQFVQRNGILALLGKDLQSYASRGEWTAVAQFYGIVLKEIAMANHVFRGLRRPLLKDGANNGDEQMHVYTWKPKFDYQGPVPHNKLGVVSVDAPIGKVFAVIVCPNNGKHATKYKEVDGWLNAWTWVEEDGALPGATQEWVDRYDMKIWSREGG